MTKYEEAYWRGFFKQAMLNTPPPVAQPPRPTLMPQPIIKPTIVKPTINPSAVKPGSPVTDPCPNPSAMPGKLDLSKINPTSDYISHI